MKSLQLQSRRCHYRVSHRSQLHFSGSFAWADDPAAAFARSREVARRAIASDDKDARIMSRRAIPVIDGAILIDRATASAAPPAALRYSPRSAARDGHRLGLASLMAGTALPVQ